MPSYLQRLIPVHQFSLDPQPITKQFALEWVLQVGRGGRTQSHYTGSSGQIERGYKPPRLIVAPLNLI
jgi:hypothetical protein